tara:strand:- start:62 stop:2089 length:2028 start_codon:yes stop_codon:yes gene_type:complete
MSLGVGGGADNERLRILSDGEVLIGGRTQWAGSDKHPNDINKLVVTGTSPADSFDSQCHLEGSETSGAVNTGGALAFAGHDGSQYRNWANIYGMKENGTGGNTASYMAFHTRAAGGSPAERLRIKSGGTVAIPAQGSSNANPRLLFESAVDANDFSFSQYEDGNGTYTMIGQNLQLNSGGNTTILDSGHRTAGILFDGRNNGALMFYTGNTNAQDEALRITKDGDILLGTDQATIGMNTADGSDNRSFSLCGGSDASQSRGALVGLFGNEHASFPGTLALRAGNVTGGHIEFSTGGTTRHYINKDGRIGLNLNPNVWHSNNQTVVQMSATNGGLNLFTRPNNAFLTNNFYYKSDDAGVFQTGANYGLMYQLAADSGSFKWHTSTTASSSAYSSATMKTRMVLEQDGTFVVGDRSNLSSPSSNQPVAFHSQRVNPDGASALVHTGIRCNLYVGSNSGWQSGDGGVIGLGGDGTGSPGQERMWAYIKGSRQSSNGWEYAGYLDLGTAGWSGNTNVKRQRIWGDGQVEYFPTDNTTTSWKIGGAQRMKFQHTGGGNMSITNSNGTMTYGSTSDYRLKKNESAITNALTTVKALKPYQFTWKSDDKLGQGFFAHEAQAVLPDIGVVTGTKDAVYTEDDRNESYKKDDPDYQAVDYAKLVPLLTAALQELEARVASLESS